MKSNIFLAAILWALPCYAFSAETISTTQTQENSSTSEQSSAQTTNGEKQTNNKVPDTAQTPTQKPSMADFCRTHTC